MNGQGSRRAPVEAWDSCIGPAGGGGAPFRSASGDGSPDTQESRPSRHHDATEAVFVLNSRASFSGMGLRRWRRGRREKPYPASLRLYLSRIALRGVWQAARASPLSLHHLPGIQPPAVRRRDGLLGGKHHAASRPSDRVQALSASTGGEAGSLPVLQRARRRVLAACPVRPTRVRAVEALPGSGGAAAAGPPHLLSSPAGPHRRRPPEGPRLLGERARRDEACPREHRGRVIAV